MFAKRGLVIGVSLILVVLLSVGVLGYGIQDLFVSISYPSDSSFYFNGISYFNWSVVVNTSSLTSCYYNVNLGSDNYFDCSVISVGLSPILQEGGYNLTLYVNNSAGEVNSNKKSFGVDSLSPRVNFTNPTPNVTVINSSSFLVNITVDELNEDSVIFRLSNESGLYMPENVTSNRARKFDLSGLPEGDYTFTVIVNDSYGHNTTINRSVRVDLPPVITFVSPTLSSGVIKNQNFVYARVNVIEKYEKNTTFYLENATAQLSKIGNPGLREMNWTGLLDGPYYYWVCVEDSFGQITCNGKFEYRNVTLDTTDPVVTLLNPANNRPFLLSQNDQVVFWNYSDANSVVDCVVYKDGEAQSSYSIQQSFGDGNYSLNDLSAGKHSWYVQCADNSNSVNVGVSATRSFTILSNLTFSAGTEVTNLSAETDISYVWFWVMNEFGIINWTVPLDLSRGLDWAKYIDLTFNSADVDSSGAPELNKQARVTLYNLTWTDPQILKDGIVCSASDCVEESYVNGTLVFNVTGFSKYTTQETPIGGSSGGGSGGGGGSSGGSGGIVLWGTPAPILGTGGAIVREEAPVSNEISGDGNAGITGAAIGKGAGIGSYMATIGFLLAAIGTYMAVNIMRGKSLAERVKISSDGFS